MRTPITENYLRAYNDKEDWARDMTPIDLCHQIEKRLCEAEKIIEDMLLLHPSPHCEDLHHAKRDRHDYAETCPVVERVEKVRRAAMDFISANTKITDRDEPSTQK